MSDFQDRLQDALKTEFRIDRELGGAGMSRVFVATEKALNRTVVVKVLPPDLAAGLNVERFRREIQLAAQLQHPHIVPLIAAGDDQGLLWFSMPYIEGESLRGTLTRQGRLSPRDVVRILHDVVDALAYAHSRGVVHRDIKPDNILTSGMHALVTDFGVAKALSASVPVHSGTSTGMAIGTPAYMAPEQLAADPAADHRVDLYAVGLLAYELLTGRSPFSGTSPQATLAAQLTVMPEPPHRTVSDIPEPLSQLIMHCLAKDAAKRPPTAQALLTALEALPAMPGHTGGARPATGHRQGARRLRAIAAAGAAALLGVVVWAAGPWRTPAATAPRAAGLATLEARDAGPGGRTGVPLTAGAEAAVRAPSGAGTTGDSAAVPRLADEARPETVTPFVITRAESLAIAEAVMRRQRSAGSPGQTARATQSDSGKIDRALLLAEVGRIFADSMTRAIREMEVTLANSPRFVRPELPPDAAPGMRTLVFDARTAPRPNAPVAPLMAPPSDGRLRVVVAAFTNATGRREVSAIARSAADDLRAGIPADRFDVVPADVTERATRTLPDKMSVGWALRADYVVTGWLLARGDSLSVVTMLTDVRTGRFTRATETMTTLTALGATPTLDNAKRQMRAWLDTAASNAARRRAAETTRR